MADTVRRVEYYHVTVSDKPGEGERILSALKESEINLLAYLGFPTGGGQSQVDLVPEDPASFRQAAERAGANINVTAAAATIAGSGRYGMILWVAPTDYERAADALGA